MSRRVAYNSPAISPTECTDFQDLIQRLSEILGVLGNPGPVMPQSQALPESAVPTVFQFPAQLTEDFTDGTAMAQPVDWSGNATDDDPVEIETPVNDPNPPVNGDIVIVQPIFDTTNNTYIYIYINITPASHYNHSPLEAGCGIDITGDTISVDTADLIGDGLTAGTGCAINVNTGCGLEIDGGAVKVYNQDLAGSGLVAGTGCSLDVDCTEITVQTNTRVNPNDIDIKTRTICAIDPGTESAWTTIHTGDTCS